SQQDARELLDTSYYALEELGRRMGEYAAQVEHDPQRLTQLRERLDLLYRLKARYGPTLPDVLNTLQRAQAELELVDHTDAARSELEAEVQRATTALAESARKLSQKRQRAAQQLAREVMRILPDLGMQNGTFNVTLEPLTELGPHGAETVQFRVALNAGFEPRDLARIASGGELSRIMLALKTLLAQHDQVPTLVFDEIDAGIGGRVAVQAGGKLRQVAENHQVLVITHLAQIAARAQHHLLVEKLEQDGSTLTRVNELTGDERVRELARMLSGDPDSSTSIEHARELLTTNSN
ncbi:MAG: DNA repair protein RecN, partial [Longimicrobiales bacterium]